MSDQFDPSDSLVESFRSERHQLRQRTLWLTIIPVLVGAVVVFVAWGMVSAANTELENTRIEVKEAASE